MSTEPSEQHAADGPTQDDSAPTAEAVPAGTRVAAMSPRHTPRDRKQVEFYKPEEKTKSALKIQQGKGMRLRDIPNVHFKLAKLRPDDDMLTALHGVLYRRQGTVTKRKKNVFEFSGFAVSTDEAKKAEMERVEEKLSKWTMSLLNKLLDCLDLPRGTGEAGQKASKIERVTEFLVEPKILGNKNIAEEVARKKALAKKRKLKQIERSEKKKEKPKAKKRKAAGEPRPRGRPKKVKTSPPAEAAEEPNDQQDLPVEDAVNEAAQENQSNGLTEEDIRTNLISILEAADLNNVSITQVIKSLADALGQDVTPWKPLIKKIAVEYTEEHVRAQMEEDKPRTEEQMDGGEGGGGKNQEENDPIEAKGEGENEGLTAEVETKAGNANGVDNIQEA